MSESLVLVPGSDPVLHEIAAQIDLGRPDVIEFVHDLSERMHAKVVEQNALGLAAVQCGIPVALFVVRTKNKRLTCVNPEVVWESPERKMFNEGCLSFPGEEVPIWRSARIKVRYLDENLKPRSHYLNELDARVFLHEYDHTRGVTMHDRKAPDGPA